MNKKELDQWYRLQKQLRIQRISSWNMDKSDYQELIRLNHLVMEASHKIHNDNMLEEDKNGN